MFYDINLFELMSLLKGEYMDFIGLDEFLKKINELNQNKNEFVLCTVVDSSGSTPRKSGAKMIVTQSCETFGTVGGGIVESEVINKAGEMLKDRLPNQLMKFELNEKGKGVCGGSMTVFLEGFYSNNRIIIFGAGHVSEAVCDLLKKMDYHITVFDNREERLMLPSFSYCERICAGYEKIEEKITSNENTDILIMTPNHQYDFEVAEKMLRKKYRFLGLMGSKKKKMELINYLKQRGFSDVEINRIHIPVGLPIGSSTPYEIAISIAAELISLKSGRR